MAQDASIKSNLALSKTPLKLYANLRSTNPDSTLRIIRSDHHISEVELDLFIELIKHLVADNNDLEQELSGMLMKDLEYMSRFRDMVFVNRVFLPLLRNEGALPLCLWPYDSEGKKWLSSYRPDSLQIKEGGEALLSHSNFMPSTLL